MQVRHILQEKGRHVIAIAEVATVGDAVKMLAEKRIGVVLVKSGDVPLAGILSERDVVRAVAADGAQALSRPVSSYMTRTCRHLPRSRHGGRIDGNDDAGPLPSCAGGGRRTRRCAVWSRSAMW